MSKNTAAKRRINPRTGGSFVRQSTGSLKQVAGTKMAEASEPDQNGDGPAEEPAADAPETSKTDTASKPDKGNGEAKDSGK
tara:strand:- start:534 stop:776 length:243 start_codon:yes stop_codon:yes gene_type:complete